MKKILLLFLSLFVCMAGFSNELPEGAVTLDSQRKMEKNLSSLPVFDGLASTKTSYDWLVHPERGYLLPQWIDCMRPIPGSFVLDDFEMRDMQPSVSWHPMRWALDTEQASGKEVMFTLRAY
ncbi:MAG: hypothetical protein LKE41_13035 [Prevotella sp.]|jgi:hypothetical protein|nr:hypothetical protein [Prevotella sp.]MCI2080961.1 hypothetical protein [Prevotella sp.]MCI2102822.1 hypothetical protein [Prevotella sp.]